jgi:lysophospholipid acyltransferase
LARPVKLITTFYLSYPLAAVLKRIPDKEPWKKNVFIVAVSMFYLVGLFDMWSGLRTFIISAGGAYLISSRIHSPYMPWIGFVFLMGHMSVSHIIRQSVNDTGAVDITGAQMVLVMKLTAFCWNVQDGRLPETDLSDFQKEHAIRTMPSLLDYTGYVFFFPAIMAGPAFDYCDYSDYITTTMFTLPPGTDPSKAPPTRKKRKIPRSGFPAALKGVFGTLWILAFLKLSAYYSTAFFLGSEYMKYNFLRRVWQLYMLGLTTRMKYYGVWTLSEGACILCGIGYNGIDPKTNSAKWDRLTNIKPWEIETAQNARAYLGFWNINTNLWLRNYMYLRVTPKGKKPGFRATLATFVTSAFWHGFYPGYYLTFVLAALVQTVAKSTYCFISSHKSPADLDSRWAPLDSSPIPYARWQESPPI